MRSRLTVYLLAIVLSFVGSNYVGLAYGQTVTCNIPPGGATCDLPGFASVIFPPGAFVTTAAFVPVTVSVTTSPQTDEDFGGTRGDLRVPYEIRMNSGNVGPATSFDVILDVPDTFISSLPPDQEIVVFAQIFGGEGEILDDFHDLSSAFDPVNKKASATLTFDAFTNQRNLERTYEAIVIVGALPIVPPAGPTTQSSSSVSPQLSPTGPVCEGSPLGSPLAGELRPTSAFRSLKRPKHDGVDYNRTADGTNVFAVAPGRIFWVDFDRRVLADGTVKGYGVYVIVKHDDLSMTLYGHLQDNSTDHLCDGIRPVPPEGCPLPLDGVIGRVGRTGGADGPHLHLEYSPRGVAFLGKGGKWLLSTRFLKDPHPCIAPLLLSSPNPILTCGDVDPQVEFSATGGWPPYSWSAIPTTARISPTADTRSATLRPPENPPSGEPEVAYRLAGLHTTVSGAGNSCINTEVARQNYGCNGQLLNDWGGNPFSCFPVNTNLGCRDGAYSLCSQLPNCSHNWVVSPAECSITHIASDPCAPITCDVRTDEMIAAGCRPCAPEMQGATVTVTDSHPDPGRRSSADMAVTVQ